MAFERRSYGAKADGADCANCPLNKRKPIFPTFKPNAKLQIIDRYPSIGDNIHGEMYKDELGAWVTERLRIAGVKADETDFTAEIMCMPGNLSANTGAMKQAVQCCSKRLKKNVADSAAPVVIACSAGIKQLTGKTQAAEHWIGWPLDVIGMPNKTLIPSFSSVVTAFGDAKPGAKAGKSDTELFSVWLQRGKEIAEGKWDWRKFKWPENFVIWENDPGLQSTLQSFKESDFLACDLETNIYDDNCITAINISNGKHTLSLPWDSYTNKKWGRVEQITDGLKQTLIQLITTKKTIWHNSGFDIPFLAGRGIKLDPALTMDTILMHAAYRPGYRHSLDWATIAHLRIPRWKVEFEVNSGVAGLKRYVECRQEVLRNYGCQDAWATFLLYTFLAKKFDEDKAGYFWRIYNEYKNLSTVALKMHARGFAYDVERKKTLGVELEQRRQEPLLRLEAAAKHFNIADFSVTKQRKLKELFSDHLKVPGLKFTSGGEESFDKSVIAKLLSYPDQRVQVLAQDVKEVKRIDKLLTTYINADMHDTRDNRIRSTVNVFGAITGRFSTSDPNIQQVPPIMKQCYVASPGMWLLKGDYDALELKLTAYVSGAKLLLEWMDQGKDMHVENVYMIFGLKEPYDKTNPQHKLLRDVSKTIAYGKIYGSGVDTMYANNVSKIPGLRKDLLTVAYKKFNELHPEIIAYSKAQAEFAQKNGYVQSYITGRRRYFYGAKADYTVTSNHPIQSTAADVANMAMCVLDKKLNWQDQFLLAQVHDELCIESADPVAGYKALKESMEAPVMIAGVERRMSITVKMGKSWDKCVEVKSEADVLKLLG